MSPIKVSKKQNKAKESGKKPLKQVAEKDVKIANPGSSKTILINPQVSEKAYSLQNKGKYVFFVATGANKPEVKEAIKRRYNVTVESVNIVNSQGKMKRFGNKMSRQQSFKRAVVTLKKGQKIEIA